jgi:hypothetical protein
MVISRRWVAFFEWMKGSLAGAGNCPFKQHLIPAKGVIREKLTIHNPTVTAPPTTSATIVESLGVYLMICR